MAQVTPSAVCLYRTWMFRQVRKNSSSRYSQTSRSLSDTHPWRASMRMGGISAAGFGRAAAASNPGTLSSVSCTFIGVVSIFRESPAGCVQSTRQFGLTEPGSTPNNREIPDSPKEAAAIAEMVAGEHGRKERKEFPPMPRSRHR